MKSVPFEPTSSEKVIVQALKKYFSIYFGKINENVMKRWVANRDYLIIWSLLLGNFKIKHICDNMIKCGINSAELKSFFNVDEKLIKDFIEFLLTKDRCKFRMALWDNDMTEQVSLLDYGVPELLMESERSRSSS